MYKRMPLYLCFLYFILCFLFIPFHHSNQHSGDNHTQRSHNRRVDKYSVVPGFSCIGVDPVTRHRKHKYVRQIAKGGKDS